MFRSRYILSLIVGAVASASGATAAEPPVDPLPGMKTDAAASAGITTGGLYELGPDVDQRVLRVFLRGSMVRTATGRPIHILVQRGVAPAKALHVRDTLAELLAPAPDTIYGQDKSMIAEALADQSTAVMVFRNEHSIPTDQLAELREAGMQGVPIAANTIALPGSGLEATPKGDGAFAALLRYVLDAGIVFVHPEYAELIDNGPGRGGFVEAAMSYYGLDADRGRADLVVDDHEIAELVERFLPPMRPLVARVEPGFAGHISLTYNPHRPITRRWRYYTDAVLVGRADASLTGNKHGNTLKGNFGDNHLAGLGGDDTLDGGAGDDTADFRGPIDDYHIEATPDAIYVIDLGSGRDGSDTLTNIERLRFSDRVLLSESIPVVGDD